MCPCFASEAKLEIKGKILFRLETKKGMNLLVLQLSKTAKI
jgi:hypothetical protein